MKSIRTNTVTYIRKFGLALLLLLACSLASVTLQAAPLDPAWVLDLDTWLLRYSTDRGNNPGNNPIDVTFGNSTFVASLGGIMASSDGVNWVRSTFGTGGRRAVAYGQGLFVAAGDGTLATSPDGLVWTEQPGGIAGSVHNIAFGNGLFVAVGDGGAILTSMDGVTWAAQESGSVSTLNGVSYGDGQFVAVGSSPSVILTSPDGSTWAERWHCLWPPLNAVTFGNGMFVAVGGVSCVSQGQFAESPVDAVPMPDQADCGSLFLGVVLTSLDGVTWTAHNFEGLFDVAFGAGVFVAVGYRCSCTPLPAPCGCTSYLISSTNGVAWVERRRGGFCDGEFLSSVAYGNRSFVVVGAGTILQSGLKPPQPRFRGIERLADGAIRLNLEAPGSMEVMLEICEDLVNWRPLTTLSVDQHTEFTDIEARGNSKRFYRAKLALP